MYKKKRFAPKQKKTTVNTKYKSSSKKTKRNIPASTTIPASMPMSQKFLFKFEDIDVTALAMSSNSVKSVEYNVNNLNALESSGTGEYPTGYDNWYRFYKNFLVHYARINVEFINNSASNAIYGFVGFRPIYNETNWSSWSEWRNLDSNCFPNKQVLMTPKGGSKDTCKISLGCNLGKLIGKPDAWNALDVFAGGTDGTAPSAKQQAFVAALSGDGTAITATITVKISIDIIATLYQLKTQSNGSST